MNEQIDTSTEGEHADKITLKRGDQIVTYEKVPDHFAVRVQDKKVKEAEKIKKAADDSKTEIQFVDSDQTEDLNLFAVSKAAELEDMIDDMRTDPELEVVTHVYKLDETPEGTMIPVGTLTVQFKSGVSEAQQAQILQAHGLAIVESLEYLPNGFTVRLTSDATENPLKIARKLQQRPEIETAEPDLSFKVELKYTPADSLYHEQWYLNNQGNRLGLLAGADVKAEAAWDISRGSRGIVVNIIDDGIDLTHPKFGAPGKIVAPLDLLQNDFNPSPISADDNHGTACAGVAVAEETGNGCVGLAPRCALMPVRMAMTLSDNAVVTLFRHAIDSNADVISCSWSAAVFNFPLSTKIDAIIRHAAQNGRANGKGCVILFAAGNENRPLNGIMADGRISHQGFALHPDVIAVGASNSWDMRSNYSNFGPELTLCAPSNGNPGRYVVTTDRIGTPGYAFGDYTFTFGGTSSATPLAAGLAALILSVNSELSANNVKQIMKETADKIDSANGSYNQNGHSQLYGYGRINAFEAVKMAKALLDL